MSLIEVILYCLWLVLLNCMQESICLDDPTLRLVSMLYRHGDRAPIHTFPNNPVPPSAWPQGLNSLTELGIQQQYRLGEFMRRYYRHFLNSSYLREEVTVRSTDRDRTLMSAESHLAGLYPPRGRERHPLKDWQPIPVHTVPISQDNLLSMEAVCPRAQSLYQQLLNTPKIQKYIKSNEKFLQFLTLKSGMNVDFNNAWIIYDAFNCQAIHDLTVPSWYNLTIQHHLDQLQQYEFSLKNTGTDDITRLRGGSLLKEMTGHMMKKTNTSLDLRTKLFMYSAHDETIAAFLQTLHLYNGLMPPITAAVLVELHRDERGRHFVTVLYKNSSSDPIALTIPGCTSECPLGEFVSLTRRYVPHDWRRECGLACDTLTSDLSSSDDTLSTMKHGLIGAGVALLLVILILSIVLIVRRHFKRRKSPFYHRLRNELDEL